MSERLVITRRFDHPRERVFAAWITPASIGRWLFRTPGGVLKSAHCEPVEGGAFQIDEQRGETLAQHFGRYLVIEPPARLVFAFATSPDEAGLQVSVTFAEDGEGCVMTLEHDAPAEWREPMRKGWTMIGDALADALRET